MAPTTGTRPWTGLDLRRDETWQGGLYRLPMWVEGDDGRPYRPWVPLWASARTGLLGAGAPRPRAGHDPDSALQALAGFAASRAAGYLPGVIEINDDALLERLLEALDGTGVNVRVTSRVPAPPAIAAWLERQAGEERIAGPMSGEGVDAGALRAFCAAARDYYLAGPWRAASDLDLFHRVLPGGIDHPAWAVVLGAAGIDRGLFLFASDEGPAQLRQGGLQQLIDCGETYWLISFSPLHELPLSDADLFEDLDLPVAAPEAHPVALAFPDGRCVRRLDANELAHASAILSAFAAADDEQLSSGRFEIEVDGELYSFAR